MKTVRNILRKLGIYVVSASILNTALADTITFLHNDLSGSPIAATDASGNILWKETYKPYGEKLRLEPLSSSNRIGFHGKDFDDATGLSYMGARYYDPVLGRFTSIDPVDYKTENLHSFNRYAYANNNPYKYVDPDGEYAFLIPYFALLFTAVLATSLTPSISKLGAALNNFFASKGNVDIPYIQINTGASSAAPFKAFKDSEEGLSEDKARAEHGEKRADQAKTDPNRQVGDRNRVQEQGQKYEDSESGHNISVKGDRVVVTTKDGIPVSQFKNTRANTRQRVLSGKWIPK